MSGSESEATVTPEKDGKSSDGSKRTNTPLAVTQDTGTPKEHIDGQKRKRGRPKGSINKVRNIKYLPSTKIDIFLKSMREGKKTENGPKQVEIDRRENDTHENGKRSKDQSGEEDEEWDDITSDSSANETVRENGSKSKEKTNINNSIVSINELSSLTSGLRQEFLDIIGGNNTKLINEVTRMTTELKTMLLGNIREVKDRIDKQGRDRCRCTYERQKEKEEQEIAINRVRIELEKEKKKSEKYEEKIRKLSKELEEERKLKEKIRSMTEDSTSHHNTDTQTQAQ